MLFDKKYYDSSLFLHLVRQAHHFKLRSLHNSLLFDHWNFRPFSDAAFQIIEVNVADILYNEKFPFDVEGKEAISGVGRGAWDRAIEDIEQKKLTLSISLRFCQGLDWSETPQYRKTLDAIKRGKESWNGCITMADLQRRCDLIDALYDDMKRNGFVASFSPVWFRKIQDIEIPDLVTVAIDRRGRIIRCEGGRHRLAIARILGIKTVPVLLLIQHEDCPAAYSRHTIVKE